MSGWIRVRELPVRYEVRTKHWVERYNVMAHAVEEHSKRQYWEQSSKLATIRRWQVKRTEVVEEHYKHFTSWRSAPGVVIETILRRDGWILSPRTDADGGMHVRREEAEAAARNWLRDNGYRIRKVAT